MPTKMSKTKSSAPAVKFHHVDLKGIASTDLSLPIARAALKNLTKTAELLSDESRWVKEEYVNDAYNEQPKYCLIGASHEINGKGENMAMTIMQQAITGNKLLIMDADDYMSSDKAINAGAGFYIGFCYDHHGYAERFNDASSTSHKDILRFLRHCIKQAEKVIADLQSRKLIPVRAKKR